MDDPELTSEEQTRRLVYAALVVLTAIGLAASSALLVDYLRPLPLFCSDTGGCAELRHSVYSHMLGVPTPAIGVAGYSILAILTIARGDIARFLHLMSAMFGALAAGFFLYVQFSLGTYCSYCMTADVSAIVLFSVALMRVRAEADATTRKGTAITAGIFALAVAAPLVSHAVIRVQVPEVIAAEMKKTPAGQVTIIDFVDFECPYCRQTASDLTPILAQYRGKYRLVRKQMPLAMHPHAAGAARAACCAETMGKGDEMADKLMSTPVADLTDDGCATIATSLGLDAQTFRACVSDPQTQKKIDADRADFTASQGHGLPTIWIGDEMIVGAVGPEKLREAIAKALGEVGG